MTSSTAAPSQTTTATASKKTGMGAMLPSLLLDIGIPAGSYYVLSGVFGMSDVLALTIGSLLAGARVLYTVIRDRKVDGFALFILALFAVSLVLTFATGDARFIVAKDSFTTGVAGLIILGTCLFGTPFTVYSAQRFGGQGDPARQAAIRDSYRTVPQVRRMHLNLSLLWGFGLLAEAALRVVLVYLLPVSTMVGLSVVMQLATFGLLFLVTVRSVRRMKRAAQTA